MDRQIENPTTGERLTLVWSDGFATYTTESQYEGRMFKDYGDGRLYEYDDNGELMEEVWTWANPRHTPGPWDFSRNVSPDYAPHYTVYAEATGNRVATAFDTEANAALIAAAPELLSALRDILTEVAPDAGTRAMPIKAAQAALARAEGR